MQKIGLKLMAFGLLLPVTVVGFSGRAQVAAEKNPYPAMAPIEQYLMADESAEIALARSAAPASIADKADVMVFRRDGYKTVVKGTNGFLCIVERGWASSTDSPDFWNPKVRAPNCFSEQAARTFAQIFLMKTKLVLAGKSKAEILAITTAAMDRKELPAVEAGAMCYMMSKQQYLGDRDKGWQPHLMFFLASDAAKSWGANLPGSPMMEGADPEERVTIFLVGVGKWSDGTAAPAMM